MIFEGVEAVMYAPTVTVVNPPVEEDVEEVDLAPEE